MKYVFALPEGFIFLFVEPQYVSYSLLRVSFLHKILVISVHGQPVVPVNYVNTEICTILGHYPA